MKTKVDFGNLGRLTENDEGSADILVGGNLGCAQCVGYITRVVSWEKPGSSRQNVATVHGYTIELWIEEEQSPALAKLVGIEFDSLKSLKDAVRTACA